MSWLILSCKPEPEVMSDAEAVDAYASAAAQAYLDAIDNTLVDPVLSLGRTRGWLLDIGTGPEGFPGRWRAASRTGAWWEPTGPLASVGSH
jgi:hypothetical protein